MERIFRFSDGPEPKKFLSNKPTTVTAPENFSEMRVARHFPYDRVGSYREGNPFVIAFCYCKNGEKFVVKGGHNLVNDYLKNYPVPMLVHRTIWKHKYARFTAGVSGRGWVPGSVFIRRNDKRGWTFKFFIHAATFFEFTRRRLPRRWMREFNDVTRTEI